MYILSSIHFLYVILTVWIIFLQPALKLLDFFRNLSAGDLQVTADDRLSAEAGGLNTFSTSKTQNISKTIRDLKPLASEDVEGWVKYWDAAGLFDDI